jgi:hypothetical protein
VKNGRLDRLVDDHGFCLGNVMKMLQGTKLAECHNCRILAAALELEAV